MTSFHKKDTSDVSVKNIPSGYTANVTATGNIEDMARSIATSGHSPKTPGVILITGPTGSGKSIPFHGLPGIEVYVPKNRSLKKYAELVEYYFTLLEREKCYFCGNKYFVPGLNDVPFRDDDPDLENFINYVVYCEVPNPTPEQDGNAYWQCVTCLSENEGMVL